MSSTPIRVLVVEDSAAVRLLLQELIESDPRLRVAEFARSGEEAIEKLRCDRPDVILMDIHLPGISGIEATRQIMQTTPVPIVICSGTADISDVTITFEAMEAGALSTLPKPAGPGDPEYAATVKNMVDTLRLMSEVKVVRRWTRTHSRGRPALRVDGGAPQRRQAKIVAVGTSTGGPPVLRRMLSDLRPDFPLPILVVQHIARGFLPGLVEWLAQSCRLPVRIGGHGERPLPGHVYFAPDEFHLGVSESGHLALHRPQPTDVLCPSVSHLFQSVADVFRSDSIGVLLTGMGRDGAQELALMKSRGAITIAQDRESSVVHGMPGEAIRLGGATYVLPDVELGGALNRMVSPS